MNANLDMNSNRILNLPLPSADTEPVRKGEFDEWTGLAEDLEDAVAAAQLAQAAAEAAEANAETSESNAATSESNAATSESNAATSESNAATSESNAATSESNAATSESNASTSAGTATAQAGIATTQAGIATTQAGNASTSATNANNSAIAAAASAQDAADALDEFDDIYLGSKTSDPTLDNDGDPLVTGQLYWNSVASNLRIYDGASWNVYSASSGLTAVVDDTNPALGGDLDLNGHVITGLEIGTNVQAQSANLDSWSMVVPSDYLTTTAAAAAYQPVNSTLTSLAGASANGVSLVTAADYAAMRALLDLEAGTDLVDDTSPQLGGNLDLNGFKIIGDGGIDARGDSLPFGPIVATGLANEDAQVSAVGYTVGPVFHGWRANGTEVSPTSANKGDLIFGIGGRSYAGSSWSSHSNAGFHFIASENHSGANQGGFIKALVTPDGNDTNDRVTPLIITSSGVVWLPDTASGTAWDPTSASHVRPLAPGSNVSSSMTISSADTDAGTAGYAVVGYNLQSVGYRGALCQGTPASPSATQSGNLMCFMGGHGHGASSWSTGTSSLVGFRASQNWTDSAQGSQIDLETTPNGSTTRVGRVRVTNAGHLVPIVDNSYSCGESGARWNVVYAASGTINTSDARDKVDVEDLSLGLDFVNSLRPITHKWRVGHNVPVPDVDSSPDHEGNLPVKIVAVPGSRRHAGLLAQDVRAALCERGIDLGMWTLDDATDSDSRQGLRYDQLIPVLIKAVQELSARLQELDRR